MEGRVQGGRPFEAKVILQVLRSTEDPVCGRSNEGHCSDPQSSYGRVGGLQEDGSATPLLLRLKAMASIPKICTLDSWWRVIITSNILLLIP